MAELRKEMIETDKRKRGEGLLRWSYEEQGYFPARDFLKRKGLLLNERQ
jgi:hypothetical protein